MSKFLGRRSMPPGRVGAQWFPCRCSRSEHVVRAGPPGECAVPGAAPDDELNGRVLDGGGVDLRSALLAGAPRPKRSLRVVSQAAQQRANNTQYERPSAARQQLRIEARLCAPLTVHPAPRPAHASSRDRVVRTPHAGVHAHPSTAASSPIRRAVPTASRDCVGPGKSPEIHAITGYSVSPSARRCHDGKKMPTGCRICLCRIKCAATPAPAASDA